MLKITNVKTKEILIIEDDKDHIIRWLKEHPPYYSWMFRAIDKKTIGVYRYQPSCTDYGIKSFIRDYSHIDLCEYMINIGNTRHIKKIIEDFDVECFHLLQTKKYSLVHLRPGLGLSEDTLNFCLEKFGARNYGDNCSFGFPNDFHLSHWGYGASFEVSYKGPHFADGTEFDTYCNYDRPCSKKLPEPSERELIEYCDRIEVKLSIDMDRKTTPSIVIDRAVRLPFDERIRKIITEIVESYIGIDE